VADWELAPCLVVLFHEFNIIAPNRDHASDGSIGDAAHQQTNSDHNPDKNGIVHAVDVDNTLNAPFTMESCIQNLVNECRKDNSVGLDRGRLKYIIYNRRIWSVSNNWAQENYTGPSPHTEHAHFSCEYDPKYANDTRSWGLVDSFGKDDLPMNQNEFNTLLANAFKDKAVADSFLDNIKVTDYAYTNKPQRVLSLRQWIGFSEGRSQIKDVLDEISVLDADIEDLAKLVETHVSGIIEGEKK
jgi:hypothetical protein